MNSGRLVSSIVKGRSFSSTSSARGIGGIPFGKRQVQQVKNWIPTLSVFGATAAVGGLYFTDWRVICEWIPFYSGKYKTDD